MALTGIEIFKKLPKTNCGECGVPTCLAFAIKLGAGQAELAACPHVSEQAKAELAEASAPALSADPKSLSVKTRSLVLTPHPGEMGKLIKSAPKEGQEDRISISRNFSTSHHLHLVLKGYRTLIATPQGDIFINPTGNPGMASGGTGDVLTGMIGGLLCQGFDIVSSLQAAVFLHGLAGDRVSSEKGEKSLVATDLIAKLPDLLQEKV